MRRKSSVAIFIYMTTAVYKVHVQLRKIDNVVIVPKNYITNSRIAGSKEISGRGTDCGL